MTQTSPKIVFFGTEDYSLGTLKTLVEHGFPVASVVTKPNAPRGRGHKLAPPPVKTYALEHDIPVWQPEKLRDITDAIRQLQPVAGILVAYGKIIPQNTIDLFTPGIINLHPSLLPRWRGPSPIEAAIANQDTETGVSIMQLKAGMDSGPVYAQQRVPLDGTETKPELYDTLFTLGEHMLIEALPHIFDGTLQPVPQDERAATYCSLLSKEQSLLDPTTLSAAEADAHIRAHLGFPRSRLHIGEHTLIITKAHTSPTADSQLAVHCKDGRYLTPDELIAPSGKAMSADAFLRGYPL